MPKADLADRVLLQAVNRARLSADISRAVVGVERSGSMEEKPAVTITVDDPRGVLMESRVLVDPTIRPLGTAPAVKLRPIDVLLDGVWYRLQAAERDADNVSLVFAHRGATLMDRPYGPLSATRGDTTRALFIRRQVDEVARRLGAAYKLAFYAREPGKRLPVAKPSERASDRAEEGRDVADTSERARKGLAGLTGKLDGHDITAETRRNIVTVLDVAAGLKAGPKATLALVMACIVEAPAFANPTGGDSTSQGILQLLASTAAGLGVNPRDVAAVAKLFLTRGFTGKGGAIDIARKNPGMSAGIVAAETQGPREDLRGRYDSVRRDAERVVAAYGGATGSGSEDAGSYAKPYRFRRGKDETAWENTGTLAGDVGRRRFVTIPVRGSDLFIYGADEDLLGLPSQAVIDLDGAVVLAEPQYRLDLGRPVQSMSLQLRGTRFDQDLAWGLPLTVRGDGAAAGDWLVWDVHETDGDELVEVTLRQPSAAKLEPAHDVVQRSDSNDTDPDGTGGSGDSAVRRAYSEADAISAKGYPYVWGGGHAKVGTPDGGTGRDPGTGYDCSGYVCAVLAAGGFGFKRGQAAMASGGLAASWGQPGEGDQMTVWANADHTFIEWKVPGKRGKYADTSRQAGGASGPRMRYGSRTTAGFTARRWPGV